jgi:glycosyltransferase involved in cell wall biosynthesis
MKRPTILQIIPDLDTGGAERTTVEIAAAIVAAGGRAMVLSRGGRMTDDLARAGGEHLVFPAATKNPLRLAANALAIASMIEREGIDLVHARSRAPAWSALAAARRTGRAFVTTYHGAYNEEGRAKKLYNGVMARGDLVIANSNYTADLVMSRYATPPARIRVIHRGVDGAIFDPARIAADRIAALRSAWGIGAGSRIVLHAARLTGWKGQSVVIEAARLLRETAPDLARDTAFVLAGDAQGRDDYRAGLRKQIAAAGLDGAVRLVGHVSDIPAAFATSWLGVVASTEPEAFGRAATESQVMGCPVIATDIGAPPETVLTPERAGRDHMTGWLVPPDDPAALAAALAAGLALTAEQRGEIGARARAHVLDRFSLFAMRQRTLAVYDELLGTRLAQAFAAATEPVAPA